MISTSFRSLIQRASQATACAALAFSASTAVAAPSGFYVFGDSLLDVGNVFLATGGATTPGTATPPSPTYYQGRWSNGPLAVDLVAGVFGFTLQPSAVGGTNYAWGGARAVSTAATSVPDVIDQVNLFTASLTAANRRADANAVYILDGGGNDIAAALTSANPAAAVAAAVAATSQSIQSLYAAGARHIIVANVPDIGATPNVRQIDAGMSAGGAVRTAATQLSQAYNVGLNTAAAALRSLAGIDLDILDLYGLGQQAQSNPAAYGFTNVVDACLTNGTVCASESTYFYWDSFHPTLATGLLVANAMLPFASIPAPGSLALLGLGGLAVLLGRRRKV